MYPTNFPCGPVERGFVYVSTAWKRNSSQRAQDAYANLFAKTRHDELLNLSRQVSRRPLGDHNGQSCQPVWHSYVAAAAEVLSRPLDVCWSRRCTYTVYNVNEARSQVYLGFLNEVWFRWFPDLPSGSPFHLFSPLHTSFLPLSFHAFLSSCLGISFLLSLARTSARPLMHARSYT